MKMLLCALMLPCLQTPSYSQTGKASEYEPKRQWKAAGLNFGLGVDWDQYKSMSLERIMVFAKHPERMQRDLANLSEDATPVTAGVALYGSIAFAPLDYRTGTYRNDRELRVGVGIHSPKEAMVTYKNEDLDTSIVYCNIHGEFTVEASYVFNGQWGKRFQWYAGGGMNAGLTFANGMIIISGRYFEPGAHPSTQESHEMNQDHYKARQVYYTRAFIPFGIHYQVSSKWSLGFDLRTGLGLQMIKGAPDNIITNTGSFILGATCHFK